MTVINDYSPLVLLEHLTPWTQLEVKLHVVQSSSLTFFFAPPSVTLHALTPIP